MIKGKLALCPCPGADLARYSLGPQRIKVSIPGKLAFPLGRAVGVSPKAAVSEISCVLSSSLLTVAPPPPPPQTVYKMLSLLINLLGVRHS